MTDGSSLAPRRENSEVCSTLSPRDFQCIESQLLTGINYSITQVTLVSLFPVSLLFLLVFLRNHFSNKPPALQPCLKVCSWGLGKSRRQSGKCFLNWGAEHMSGIFPQGGTSSSHLSQFLSGITVTTLLPLDIFWTPLTSHLRWDDVSDSSGILKPSSSWETCWMSRVYEANFHLELDETKVSGGRPYFWNYDL